MWTDDARTALKRTGNNHDKGCMWTDDTRTAMNRTGSKPD